MQDEEANCQYYFNIKQYLIAYYVPTLILGHTVHCIYNKPQPFTIIYKVV